MSTMRPDYPEVKRRRPYDASGRRERAAGRKDRVVEAARQRFLRDGYAITTIAAIATDADVSPDTIYKSFGGKPGLVRAIRDRALLGAGPTPAEQRSDDLHGTATDATAVIRGWGRLSAEVAPLVVPVVLLLRTAAAADPEVQALYDEVEADRLWRMTHNARRLADSGQFRAGVTLDEAVDVLFAYSSAELYEVLVLRRGWTPARYGSFIAEAMVGALL